MDKLYVINRFSSRYLAIKNAEKIGIKDYMIVNRGRYSIFARLDGADFPSRYAARAFASNLELSDHSIRRLESGRYGLYIPVYIPQIISGGINND